MRCNVRAAGASVMPGQVGGSKKRAPAGWCSGALVGSKNRVTFSALYHCDQKPSVKEACSEEEEEAAAVPLPYHFFSLLLILLDSVVGSP